jgi:hypothetical protein
MQSQKFHIVPASEKPEKSTISFMNHVAVLPETKRVKKEIRNIRAVKSPASEKKVLIAEECMKHLKKYAQFAIDSSTAGNDGLICLQTGDIYEISKKSELLSAFMFENYGINAASAEYRYLLSVLHHSCFINIQTKVKKHFFYDSAAGLLTFPLSRREIVICTEKDVKKVPNGTDGFFIKPFASFSEFSYKGQDEGQEGNNIFKYLFSDIHCSDKAYWCLNKAEAAFLLEILFFFIPFANSMATRPILIIHGAKGAGKSSLLKRIGIAHFGPKFSLSLMPRSRRDLETELENNIFCCFDNVDRDPRKSQRDALAANSTDAGFRARKLYSDSDQMSYSPRPLIAITTRNPAFSADDDDIVNRAIIINLATLQEVIPENELISNIEKNRDAVLSEMVNKMPAVISALKNDTPPMADKSFRMADFATFAYKSAFAIFKERLSDEKISETLNIVFFKVSRAQRAYLASDPLHHVVDEYIARITKAGQLKKSTSDLFNDLLLLDKTCKFGFAKICQNVISFGKLMANNESIFAERYGYSRTIGTGNKTQHAFTGMQLAPLQI